MSQESENNPAQRVDDKRPETELNWREPRFNALGIAETWMVTVEAEGRGVLCIGDQYVVGLDGEIEQFHETIRSCALHLLGFIGSSPVTATATPVVQAHSAPAAQSPMPADREKLLRAALEAAEKLSQQEHLHERDIGRGGPGLPKKVERAEREARAAIRALAESAPVPAAAEVPGQWISVEDRLPEKYCLAAYMARYGKHRIIRAMYVKQYEIEANGDECDCEYNEADDMEYIKAGWYECVDNWGELSICFVNEGTVTHWMPLPAAPSQQSAQGEMGGEA